MNSRIGWPLYPNKEKGERKDWIQNFGESSRKLLHYLSKEAIVINRYEYDVQIQEPLKVRWQILPRCKRATGSERDGKYFRGNKKPNIKQETNVTPVKKTGMGCKLDDRWIYLLLLKKQINSE